ncbi:unnamed protein product [Hermetia illucens]|uniref:NB-ARC domain-containing protein n=1 Tax=Hermetia illucens TaxID=343691 RepID=A0A7R8Z116_HERIL|nr:unnamed protein product [Hermetia illucens]
MQFSIRSETIPRKASQAFNKMSMSSGRDSNERFRRTESVETEHNKLLRDILEMHLDDFLQDFAFADIQIYVNSQGIIFTEEDLQKILSLKNEKLAIILMFQILGSKNKNLLAFIDILGRDYGWLREKLNSSLQTYNENKDFNKYLNVRHELKSRIPKHVDNNVRRIDLYAKTRDFLKELRPWHYLVIYGELGYGKKWLALDACCDYSVIKAMDYKIFWLDVHNCNSQEKDLEKLQRLKIMLGETSSTTKIGDYEGISNKILELQQDLKTILKQDHFKDCLLVLADVQNTKTLETFSLPCKILITTRNKKVMEYLPKTNMEVVNIERGLLRNESVELFERIMEKEAKFFPPSFYEIIENSKSHPFLLNIIAQGLKGHVAKEWDMWTSNLQHFRIQNDKINAVIKLSLNVLKPDELELFHTLSIFYHSVKIPVSLCF